MSGVVALLIGAAVGLIVSAYGSGIRDRLRRRK